jgi:hypothetical protein
MANGDNAENDNTLNATGGRLRVAAEEIVDERHRVLFQSLADAAESGLVVAPDRECDARKPDGETHGEDDERHDNDKAHV